MLSAVAAKQLTTAESSAIRLYCGKSRAWQDLSRYHFLLKILTFRGLSLESCSQREGEINLHSEVGKKLHTQSQTRTGLLLILLFSLFTLFFSLL